ncbi:aconitate hydratase AcnA [Poseidonibacter lekithochrous]|uniref:aconitate hydratase AcnA n=1 Tax=Poseidonibacter lekithochrous TaxID=1904463 RepID=UPI000D3925CD|nr:aconitate hydratase AcnA [Poseidonibacter lekithochrous]
MNKFINNFEFAGHTYFYYDLKKVFETYPALKKLPITLKLLLESNLRNAKDSEFNTIIDTFISRNNYRQINFYSSRVIMKDFSGIPALVDLASMRQWAKNNDEDVEKINPQLMLDLVIDNSSDSSEKELNRNAQRYKFVKWAENNFKNITVIPPSSTNFNQVNLEYLSTMISAKSIDNKICLFPESIVGTDSHSSMINALGVLGFKVGNIEVESTILGSNLTFDLPEVIGINISGSLVQGVSINDISLALNNLLKDLDLKNKFIEFYGDALRNISIEDRVILSQISKDNNARCAYFIIDENTISFVEKTRGVDASLIKTYYEKQCIYNSSYELVYDENVSFDLSKVRPIISGPKRVEDKTSICNIPSKLDSFKNGNFVKDNDIVLSSISFNINNSDLSLLVQAGLIAKKAITLGMSINSNIKKVLYIQSTFHKMYLEKLDLLQYFEKLGFQINFENNIQDELVERVSLDIEKFNLNVSSLNFGKDDFSSINYKQIKSNWILSPALIIAYSLRGNMNIDITKEAIWADIYLSDIWPSIVEVNDQLEELDSSVYTELYKNIFEGNEYWQNIEYKKSSTYEWDEESTYIQGSKFTVKDEITSINIENAKILAILDDSISTEHLSPLGQIPSYSPAAVYLESKGLKPDEFNTFANRRGNAEIIERGTLSNIRLRNKMVLPKEGGYTKDFETGELLSIFEFAQNMKAENKNLVLFAGQNYGVGQSRDWAAKGTKLLGVKAVIAKSFDLIHKLNLIKMGILPLEFIDDDINTLSLKGNEIISIRSNMIITNSKINLEIKRESEIITITLQSTLDSNEEIMYYKNGGVLSYLLKGILTQE